MSYYVAKQTSVALRQINNPFNMELTLPVVEVDAAVPLTAGASPLAAVFHHSSLGLGGVT